MDGSLGLARAAFSAPLVLGARVEGAHARCDVAADGGAWDVLQLGRTVCCLFQTPTPTHLDVFFPTFSFFFILRLNKLVRNRPIWIIFPFPRRLDVAHFVRQERLAPAASSCGRAFIRCGGACGRRVATTATAAAGPRRRRAHQRDGHVGRGQLPCAPRGSGRSATMLGAGVRLGGSPRRERRNGEAPQGRPARLRVDVK